MSEENEKKPGAPHTQGLPPTQDQNSGWRSSILSDHAREAEDIHFGSSWSENKLIRKATIITGFSLVGVCLGLGVYFTHDAAPDELPVIVADAKPAKQKIETEKGTVAHQDKYIYGQLHKPQEEEKVTLAQSEPETPHAKPPVFPDSFIESLDEHHDDVDMPHVEQLISPPKKTSEPVVVSDATPDVSLPTHLPEKPQPTSENLPKENTSLSQEMEKLLDENSPEPIPDLASKKAEHTERPSHSYETPHIEAPQTEPVTNPPLTQEPTPSEKSDPTLASVPSPVVVAEEEPKSDAIDHAEIPVTTSLANPQNHVKETSVLHKGDYIIQVASLRHESGAQEEWNKIKEKAGAILKGYDSMIQKIDLGRERGIFYRVLLGPFSQTNAKELCQDLKRHGITCFTRPY